jgi:NTE family protein
MVDEGNDYDIMCGVSVGALNVAGLSRYPKGKPSVAAEALEMFWRDRVTRNEDIYRRWFPFGRLHALWKRSLYDSSPLRDLVHSSFDGTPLKEHGRKLAVGAVCLDTGEHGWGTENDPNFADWVLASASFPVFMEPVEIDGKLWSDGGVYNVTPLRKAIELGATEIDVVCCFDPWGPQGRWNSERKAAVPDGIIRVTGLMNDAIARYDIEVTGLKNEIGDPYRHATVRAVVPKTPLNVSSLEFNSDSVSRLIEQGYRDSERPLIWI